MSLTTYDMQPLPLNLPRAHHRLLSTESRLSDFQRHAHSTGRWAMLCQTALGTPEQRQPVLMHYLAALFHSSIVVTASLD
jgi:hypothetical protein